MKKLLLLLWVAFMLPSTVFAEIDWVDDYEEGLAQAKHDQKKVMLVFSRSDCHVCEMMKDEVYANDEVATYVNENFVAIDINVEFDGKLGYKVYGTPTYYFLTPEAKQIGKMKLGGATVEGFMKTLKTANK